MNTVGETNMTMPSHPSQPHGQTGGPFAVRRRHLQHFNFRPFQRHLSRTMATMQSPATSSAEQDLVDLGLEHGGSQLTAGSHDRPLFEQFLQDPEDSHISQVCNVLLRALPDSESEHILMCDSGVRAT